MGYRPGGKLCHRPGLVDCHRGFRIHVHRAIEIPHKNADCRRARLRRPLNPSRIRRHCFSRILEPSVKSSSRDRCFHLSFSSFTMVLSLLVIPARALDTSLGSRSRLMVKMRSISGTRADRHHGRRHKPYCRTLRRSNLGQRQQQSNRETEVTGTESIARWNKLTDLILNRNLKTGQPSKTT